MSIFIETAFRLAELGFLFKRAFSRYFSEKVSNKILLGSIAGSIGLILIVVYIPVVRDFLRFAPISIADWLYVIGAAGIFILTFETIKIFRIQG